MTRIGALLSSSLALLVGILATEGASHARSVSASLAQPRDGRQSNCLTINDVLGSVTNTCPARVDILIPLPTDNSGFKTVTFTSRFGRTVENVAAACQVLTNDRFGTTPPGHSLSSSIPSGSTFALRTLTPSVELKPFGTLHLFCVLQPQSEIMAVDYNE